MTDTSNYRPVAVATRVSKLLEHFLSSISPFLGTTYNQFDCKAGIVLVNAHYCCRKLLSDVRRNFSWGGLHSVAYDGHFHLVCALSDVIIWRHIHVSKPTFWRSLLK